MNLTQVLQLATAVIAYLGTIVPAGPVANVVAFLARVLALIPQVVPPATATGQAFAEREITEGLPNPPYTSESMKAFFEAREKEATQSTKDKAKSEKKKPSDGQ